MFRETRMVQGRGRGGGAEVIQRIVSKTEDGK